MTWEKKNTIIVTIFLALFLCSCSTGDPSYVEPKYLTLSDLEDLDGKTALSLLEQNGLELNEHYASDKNEAADAVVLILSDLKNGRTDPERLYSMSALIDLHGAVKSVLKVPDRLQLYHIHDLAAEKGDKISWEDLKPYEYEETGEDTYFREYPVGSEQEYALVLSGRDLSSLPDEISLFLLEDGVLDIEEDHHIDIRTDDIAEFLSKQ